MTDAPCGESVPAEPWNVELGHTLCGLSSTLTVQHQEPAPSSPGAPSCGSETPDGAVTGAGEVAAVPAACGWAEGARPVGEPPQGQRTPDSLLQ